MAYYKDLSEYEYSKYKVGNTVNIGWLDGRHEYSKGKAKDEFIAALWEYIKYPINRTRGIFCNVGLDGEYRAFYALHEGYDIALGDAEIRVINQQKNVTYAAPNMILHYVMNHQYLPPQEFIESVINGPKPDSDEYREAIKEVLAKNDFLLETSVACKFCGKRHNTVANIVSTKYAKANDIKIVDSIQRKMRIACTSEDLVEWICNDCGKKFYLPYQR